MERTFIAVKPDGVRRKLVGVIISRFEALEFDLLALKMLKVTRSLAEQHYAEHSDKPFFGSLVEFITSSEIVAMMWSGPNIIQISRNIIGATDPSKAVPGSIRGDYAFSKESNVIHGSDSPVSAERELGLFFPEYK